MLNSDRLVRTLKTIIIDKTIKTAAVLAENEFVTPNFRWQPLMFGIQVSRLVKNVIFVCIFYCPPAFIIAEIVLQPETGRREISTTTIQSL